MGTSASLQRPPLPHPGHPWLSSSFSGHDAEPGTEQGLVKPLWVPRVLKDLSSVCNLYLSCVKATASCSPVTFRFWGSQTPQPKQFKHYLERTVDKERPNWLLGSMRMHRSIRPVWTSKSLWKWNSGTALPLQACISMPPQLSDARCIHSYKNTYLHVHKIQSKADGHLRTLWVYLPCRHRSFRPMIDLWAMENHLWVILEYDFYAPAYFFSSRRRIYILVHFVCQHSVGIWSRRSGSLSFFPETLYFAHNLHNSVWLQNLNHVALAMIGPVLCFLLLFKNVSWESSEHHVESNEVCGS